MNSVHVLAFVVTLLFSLVMGVLWGTWISLARSMHQFPADMVFMIGQAMIGNLAKPMRTLMLATLTGTVIFDVHLLPRWHALGLGLVALACMVGIIAVTLIVNVPIDRQIQVWSPQTLPPDWQITVGRWQRYHAARTALSIVGFSALLGACASLR